MSLSPEQIAEYELARKPFLESGSAISEEESRMKPWRVFLEINSACNLHCPTCTKGGHPGYEHLTGIMDTDLMERCLDKIKSENPSAIVFLYGNSEPFIHPRLHECITATKQRGLNCQLSTNLNYIHHVPEVLAAKPDLIIISLSGFTQEVYAKGHAGGHIDKVKDNMKVLGETNAALPEADRVNIAVNYHVYTDNQHEIAPMKEYATSLGIGFFTSYARAISMENAIQYCRHHDPEATAFEVQENRPDWNHALPPIGEMYKSAMERVVIPPTKAREMYQQWPMLKACPISHMFSFIRHDGKISLCACVADRRIVLGNYLDMSQEERMEKSYDHAVCQQCLKYRMSYYFHLVNRESWVSPI